jgi:hypothetical protein
VGADKREEDDESSALTGAVEQVSGVMASGSDDPLEGRLLERSSGEAFVYHDGAKYALQLVRLDDHVTDAIPLASVSQWNAEFSPAPPADGVAPALPSPTVPGYS